MRARYSKFTFNDFNGAELNAGNKNKKVSPPKRGKRPSPTKSTKQNEEKAAANRQLAAIILFAVSVFFICLSFINGGGLWGGLRTLSFGLFGFSAFIWPLVLIYVAVMATLDKTDQKSELRFLRPQC